MTATAALLAAGLLALGCGSDSGGDDEAEIRAAAALGLRNVDVERSCNEAITSKLIGQTFGTRAKCVSIRNSDKGDGPRAVAVNAIDVDGDAATAVVSLTGGDADGARGEISLAREGGDWRIDDFSAAYLRSRLANAKSDDAEVAEATQCVARSVPKLSDAEVRSFAYAVIGEKPEGQNRTLQLLGECPGENGRSVLFGVFQKQVTQAMQARDADPYQQSCVEDGFAENVTDEQLADVVAQGGNAQAALTTLIEPILKECGAVPDGTE